MNDTIRKQQAVSLLNAMAPLVGTVINPQALAAHVLKTGFDIKDPERFLMQPQAGPQAGGPEGPPAAPPGGAQGPTRAAAPPTPPPGAPLEGAFAPTGGVPPELLLQLKNQMGLELPAL